MFQFIALFTSGIKPSGMSRKTLLQMSLRTHSLYGLMRVPDCWPEIGQIFSIMVMDIKIIIIETYVVRNFIRHQHWSLNKVDTLMETQLKETLHSSHAFLFLMRTIRSHFLLTCNFSKEQLFLPSSLGQYIFKL